jgi:arylsulfatase A-like enzyme
MYSNILVSIFILFLFTCPSSNKRQKIVSTKPNIVVILADDMGYSDLGCMGGEINTPNLDRLANNGLLFTHCYNASRCAPSRASLLTGLYQHNTGVGHMVADLGYPSYQGFLNKRCVTIAEVLQNAGYSTNMAGKWHVGDSPENWPNKRGFDNFFGIPKGGGLYFYPSKFIDRPIYRNSELVKPDSVTFYSTDNFTTEAIKFISMAESANKPFFLYLPYIAPHFPLQAWPGDIAKYRGIYDTGYENIRQNRFARQQKLGIVAPELKLSMPDYQDWSEVNVKEESFKMAVYAAMVDRMDQNIGRLINHLESMGQLKNTLILFLSDNGACAETVNRSPKAEIGTASSFVSYGKNWANVGNTPYRKYKSHEHEGGTLTPLIAHWPEGIKKGKRLVTNVIHIIDIMPTCLDIAGVDYPEQFNGNSILPLDGKSFYPVLMNEEYEIKRTLFWEHQGNKAIRVNDKKLVKGHNKAWELYDLKSDPTELNDLITREPELAGRLEDMWNTWANECQVLEWPLKKNR